jgi:glutamate-1-semialdehyde 2,1-aminomutase
MNREKSNALYTEARKYMPAGVNSPVRAFQSVHDTPFYVKKAKGSYLFDLDGNTYLDYVSSWGAIILGHAHDGLIEEVKTALEEGTSFGACHPNEIKLASLITEAFTSIELLRLTSSGTEATMSAVRLARGFTGKDNIIKFKGCYHGHVDSLLVKAGSGLATYGIPDSKGIPEVLAKCTYVADFNNIDNVRSIVKENKNIACIILEPVMGNMGLILPEKGFLEGLQEICRQEGILLIFDEVITGFRVGYGGVQHMYGIDPDITCLGKIIGGGFPIGVFGGKKEIMDMIAPLGGVYQAGTLSGNPIAVRAGIYVLEHLRDNSGIYASMDKYIKILETQLLIIADKFGIPYRINHITGMFTGFFSKNPVKDNDSALASDRVLYEKYFKLMLEEGIFFAPSPFEASFLTASYGETELMKTIDAFEKIMKTLKDFNK